MQKARRNRTPLVCRVNALLAAMRDGFTLVRLRAHAIVSSGSRQGVLSRHRARADSALTLLGGSERVKEMPNLSPLTTAASDGSLSNKPAPAEDRRTEKSEKADVSRSAPLVVKKTSNMVPSPSSTATSRRAVAAKADSGARLGAEARRLEAPRSITSRISELGEATPASVVDSTPGTARRASESRLYPARKQSLVSGPSPLSSLRRNSTDLRRASDGNITETTPQGERSRSKLAELNNSQAVRDARKGVRAVANVASEISRASMKGAKTRTPASASVREATFAAPLGRAALAADRMSPGGGESLPTPRTGFEPLTSRWSATSNQTARTGVTPAPKTSKPSEKSNYPSLLERQSDHVEKARALNAANRSKGAQ